MNTRFILLKGNVDVPMFVKECRANKIEPSNTVFIFPGNAMQHADRVSLYSIKFGNNLLAKVAQKLSAYEIDQGICINGPTLSLPTINMEVVTGVEAIPEVAQQAVAALWQAVGFGLNIALPVRQKNGTEYFTEGIDEQNADVEPDFWGGVPPDANRILADFYLDGLRKLKKFCEATTDDRQQLLAELEQLYTNAYQLGRAAYASLEKNEPLPYWFKGLFLARKHYHRRVVEKEYKHEQHDDATLKMQEQIQQKQEQLKIMAFKKSVLEFIKEYIAWWKLPFTKIGHHHDGRARKLRDEIKKASSITDITNLLANQITIMQSAARAVEIETELREGVDAANNGVRLSIIKDKDDSFLLSDAFIETTVKDRLGRYAEKVKNYKDINLAKSGYFKAVIQATQACSINGSLGIEARKDICRFLDAYISIFKCSFFGHHFNAVARQLRRSILNLQNNNSEIRHCLMGEKAFLEEMGSSMPGVLARSSYYKQFNKALERFNQYVVDDSQSQENILAESVVQKL